MGYIQYNYLKQNYPNKTEVDKQVDTLNTKITAKPNVQLVATEDDYKAMLIRNDNTLYCIPE